MVNYFLAWGLLAVTSALLVPFGLIVRYGSYTIQEPNTGILFSEIALLSALFCFPLVYLIKGLRR